jgi:Protein of unknown function (DUF2927)
MLRRHFTSASLMAIAALAATIATGAAFTATAENDAISMRRAAQRTQFSDEEIKDGLFKIAFRAELQFGRHEERIRKFDEPVRIFIDNRGAPARTATVAAIVEDINARINHLDLAITSDRRNANAVVILVPKRDFASTIRSRYGESAARTIAKSLHPQCLSGIAKDESYRIRRAEVIVPSDGDEFAFYDCAYEELLQSLGLINDDSSVPFTMFNDDVQMGFFDVYDQYLENVLYDPRVRPGMSRAEVDALLPDVLPAVRAFVAQVNSAKDNAAGDSGDSEHTDASATGGRSEYTQLQQRR